MRTLELPPFIASYRTPISLGCGLIILLTLSLWAFYPGLGGVLIFDDYPNLAPWQNIGDINSLQEVLNFIFSGTGTPGRPLSLLSFLIDDQSWAPDIYSLKRTSLAIHLINSCLVFWLCLKLTQYLLPSKSTLSQGTLALFAAAIWTLHPLQVSNVSYIIQRMNLLSTLLELCGLLFFIRGREQLETSPKNAFLLCSFAIGFCMPAAILFKENGLLLCAFCLLIEAFCFAPNRQRCWRLWKWVFLWFPLLAFLAYSLIEHQFFTLKLAIRDFNSWERLLTQGPVVADYIGKLLLPRLHGSGLYFDNFPVSRGLLQPANTLPNWFFLLSLLAFAWLLRRRTPLFSFGIFFYFIGHLMESTLLPLELYFEHRNYFPQLGLWLSLVALLSLTTQARVQKLLTFAAVLLLALLALMTRHNSYLWGKPELQTAVWYQNNPDSLRTTLSYANMLLEKGDYDGVRAVLEIGVQKNPNSLVLVISQRYVQCYMLNKAVSFSDLPALARRANHEFASIIMLEKMRAFRPPHTMTHDDCQPASMTEIAEIYLALLDNPHYSTTNIHTRLYEYLGEIAASQGKLNEAMHYYDQAYSNSKNPIYPYRQAAMLHSAGLHKDAQTFTTLAWKSLDLRHTVLYPELESRLIALDKEIQGEQQHEK